KPQVADTRKVFPIQDPQLLGAMGLKAATRYGPTYFTFNDLEPKLDDIAKQTMRIGKMKAAERAAWERGLLKLRNAILVSERLKNSLQPNSFLEKEANGKPIT